MPAKPRARVGVEQLHRDAGRSMAMARGVYEVDAVKAGRIPGACVALACSTFIYHVFDLWKGLFDV